MKAVIASQSEIRAGASYLDCFAPGNCVIYYGSLEFGERVRRESSWIPGVIHNRKAYRCRNYYPKLGKWLLAEEYAFIPYGDLPRIKDSLFEKYGEADCIFIRPDSGSKPFTGQLLELERFDKDYQNLGFYQLEPETLCVVSPPRNVENEWRFISVDRKIITGSQYRNGEKLYRLRCNEGPAFELAQEIANAGYDPDRVYCIDICQTKNGNYYLLEIGCFSCAGLYTCNKETIVKEVSRIALEEHKAYMG